jgi:hypothetical protein
MIMIVPLVYNEVGGYGSLEDLLTDFSEAPNK